jgi:hypothetical protein
MIGQYLSNNNEKSYSAILKKKIYLNRPLDNREEVCMAVNVLSIQVACSDVGFPIKPLFRLKKISTRWIVPLSSYLANIVQL